MRRAFLLAAVACVALGLFAVRPRSGAGPVMRDFESYYAAGATARYDGDPYGRDLWRAERAVPGVNASRDELLPFVGPPFGLPLWTLLAHAPWRLAVPAWAAVLALAAASLAIGALRLAGPYGPWDVAAVLVFGAGFAPLTSGLALGQVAVVSCAAIVWTLLLLRRGPLLGATLAALVALLQPNLGIVLAARWGDRRAAIALTGAAALAAGGSLLAASNLAHAGNYLAIVARHSAAERFLAIQTTPAAIARALGAPASLATMIGLSVAAVTLAIVVAQLASRRYGPVARVALVSTALPLALPFSHEHDFALAFMPAVLCARSANGRLWVLAAGAALVTGVDWLGLAQRPQSATQTLLLCLAAGFALAALRRGAAGTRHALPALLTACGVALAAAIAAQHPLPVWPQSLPLDFHAPLQLDAAAVWHLEQLASGVAALHPVSGVLRACSLAGSAALWLAASLILREPATELVSRRRSEPSSTARRAPAATYPSA